MAPKRKKDEPLPGQLKVSSFFSKAKKTSAGPAASKPTEASGSQAWGLQQAPVGLRPLAAGPAADLRAAPVADVKPAAARTDVAVDTGRLPSHLSQQSEASPKQAPSAQPAPHKQQSLLKPLPAARGGAGASSPQAVNQPVPQKRARAGTQAASKRRTAAATAHTSTAGPASAVAPWVPAGPEPPRLSLIVHGVKEEPVAGDRTPGVQGSSRVAVGASRSGRASASCSLVGLHDPGEPSVVFGQDSSTQYTPGNRYLRISSAQAPPAVDTTEAATLVRVKAAPRSVAAAAAATPCRSKAVAASIRPCGIAGGVADAEQGRGGWGTVGTSGGQLGPGSGRSGSAALVVNVFGVGGISGGGAVGGSGGGGGASAPACGSGAGTGAATRGATGPAGAKQQDGALRTAGPAVAAGDAHHQHGMRQQAAQPHWSHQPANHQQGAAGPSRPGGWGHGAAPPPSSGGYQYQGQQHNTGSQQGAASVSHPQQPSQAAWSAQQHAAPQQPHTQHPDYSLQQQQHHHQQQHNPSRHQGAASVSHLQQPGQAAWSAQQHAAPQQPHTQHPAYSLQQQHHHHQQQHNPSRHQGAASVSHPQQPGKAAWSAQQHAAPQQPHTQHPAYSLQQQQHHHQQRDDQEGSRYNWQQETAGGAFFQMWQQQQQQQQNHLHLGAAAPAGAAPAVPAAAVELFRGLNDAQREAVSSEPDNPLLIVAGAGTGKTTTLIRRMTYMIQVKGIPSKSILCITFTNKAAAEVRERLQHAGVDPRGLTAATFHSFCFGLLRFFHKAVGFAQCPTVWTDADLKRAVGLALRLVNLERGRADLVAWLGLEEARAPWKEIFAKVQSDHPDVWSSCAEKAKELEEKQQKKKRKGKQQRASEEEQQAGRGRKKANKGEPAAPTAGPAAPNPGPDTTAANAAGAGGSGSGSAAAAPGSSHEDEAANQQAAEGSAAAERLLYRAELVTLLYDKLAERFVLPGQVPQKLGAKPKASTVNYELAWIDRVKRADDYNPGQWMEGKQQLFDFYTSILRASNAIDFNDMLGLVARMVKEHKGILNHLQKRYSYLLVDEYQDCSKLQVELLQLLSGGSGRITAVGDDAQSIYRFRGALPGVFAMFRGMHEHEHDLRETLLEENYRSRPKVLTVAAHVLEGAEVTKKVLRPTKADTALPITFIEAGTPTDEAEAIADEIQRLLQGEEAAAGGGAGGVVGAGGAGGAGAAAAGGGEGGGGGRFRPGDIAVLFRCFKLAGCKTHMQLQSALRFRGIPFVLVRDKSVFERAEVQDVLSYLRLALNPADDAAFLRVHNTPPRGLGAKFGDMLRGLQDSLDRRRNESGGPPTRPPEHSLYGLCGRLLDAGADGNDVAEGLMGHELSALNRNGAKKLVQVVEELRRDVWQLGPAGAIARVLELTGYVDWWAKKKANKERTARDAAEQLAVTSPGGGAAPSRQQARRALDAQDSDVDSDEEEEEDADEEEGEQQEGAHGDMDGDPDGEAASAEGEEDEEEGDDGLGPLPAGLRPEPPELREQEGKVLGLRLLFKEAQGFAKKWTPPGRAAAPQEQQQQQPHDTPSVDGAAGAGLQQQAPSCSGAGRPVPELFQIAGRALLQAFSGEQVMAAMREVHPRSGLPRAPPHLLEQLYAEQRRGPLVLRDFLAHVALSDKEVAAGVDAQPPGPEAATAAPLAAPGRRAVSISTIHAAKGLEFPVVFVARWCEGYLPTLARPDKDVLSHVPPDQQAAFLQQDAEAHCQEERRLAHVAVTRAMERLYIMAIRVHRLQGKCWLVAPSSITLPSDPAVVAVRVLPASSEEEDMAAKAENNNNGGEMY